MKDWNHIIFWIIVLSYSCSTTKSLQEEMSREELIQFSIQDFLKKGNSRNFKTFHLSIYDPLAQMELNRDSDGSIEWVVGDELNDIVAISILPSGSIYLMPDSFRVNQFSDNIPSRVIEKDGLLFYWFDISCPITEETISILNEYKMLLSYSQENILRFYDQGTDDTIEGVHYYFCKKDNKIYSRVKSTKAIGFYQVPNISCR